jgi:hypothetical protein
VANITLSIDDETLEAGRRYAQKKGMSLNALIRVLLSRTVTKSAEGWLEDTFRMMDQTSANSRGKAWKREDLYHG